MTRMTTQHLVEAPTRTTTSQLHTRIRGRERANSSEERALQRKRPTTTEERRTKDTKKKRKKTKTQ